MLSRNPTAIFVFVIVLLVIGMRIGKHVHQARKHALISQDTSPETVAPTTTENQTKPVDQPAVSTRDPAASVQPPTPIEPTLSSPAVPTPKTKKKSSPTEEAALTYFYRNLQGFPAVQRIYRSVQDRLPPSAESDLLATYIAEGIARNGSPEFARFMTDLHTALHDRSQALADLISQNEKALQSDPFTYQMTLNLAARLNLPTEQRAQLLGGAMKLPFALDPVNGVTPMTRNITNAFILMKNYGITAEQAEPYIRQGIQVNQGNPEALREFMVRVRTYFPSSHVQ